MLTMAGTLKVQIEFTRIFAWSQDIAVGFLGGPRSGQLGNVGAVPGSKRFFSLSNANLGF